MQSELLSNGGKTIAGFSSRKEFWYFFPFLFGGARASTLDALIFRGQASPSLLNLSNLVQVVSFFWLLPLTVRRFHDAGFSGYLLLMCFQQFALALSPHAVVLFVDTL
jgi:uncharacterized membrane protein YhaH (DUF805 family)